jgi:hypothetical protein
VGQALTDATHANYAALKERPRRIRDLDGRGGTNDLSRPAGGSRSPGSGASMVKRFVMLYVRLFQLSGCWEVQLVLASLFLTEFGWIGIVP